MEKLLVISVLLLFTKIAVSQRLPRIPPEAAGCDCQVLPLPGSSFLRSPNNVLGVTFRLFSGSSDEVGSVINPPKMIDLNMTRFNPELPLKVITHGWMESTDDSPWMHAMRRSLQSTEDLNVILVDWSAYSYLGYLLAADSTQHVGTLLGDLLKVLKINYPSFDGRKVHLIGFSMGAHISGIAGHRFGQVYRITGLDPAGPNFECFINRRNRLDSSDANFVDIVHTNAGCILSGHIGYRTPLGHQDFYINGGGEQPGCPHLLTQYTLNVLSRSIPSACHHMRAVEHYLNSITGETVEGTNCRSYSMFRNGFCRREQTSVFGYYANPNVRPRRGRPLTFFLSI